MKYHGTRHSSLRILICERLALSEHYYAGVLVVHMYVSDSKPKYGNYLQLFQISENQETNVARFIIIIHQPMQATSRIIFSVEH